MRPLSARLLAAYLVTLGQTTVPIAREPPCDDHTAEQVVWTIQEWVLAAGLRVTSSVAVGCVRPRVIRTYAAQPLSSPVVEPATLHAGHSCSA